MFSCFVFVISCFVSVFSCVVFVFSCFVSVFSCVVSVFSCFVSVFSCVVSVFSCFVSVFSCVVSVFSYFVSVFSCVVSMVSCFFVFSCVVSMVSCFFCVLMCCFYGLMFFCVLMYSLCSRFLSYCSTQITKKRVCTLYSVFPSVSLLSVIKVLYYELRNYLYCFDNFCQTDEHRQDTLLVIELTVAFIEPGHWYLTHISLSSF